MGIQHNISKSATCGYDLLEIYWAAVFANHGL